MNKDDLENLYETYELSIKNLTNKNKELQQEIEDLKADYGSKAQVERDILQDRIEKAIEYINNNKNKLYQGRNDFTCEIQYSDEVVKANELLDILKGEDTSKENKITKWGNYVIDKDIKKCNEKDLREYISLIMETQNEIIDRLNGEDNE